MKRNNNQALVFTIEEFDDVSEVHVVINDDFSVEFNQSERKEERKMSGTQPPCHPYQLPYLEHIAVQKF